MQAGSKHQMIPTDDLIRTLCAKIKQNKLDLLYQFQ